MSVHSVFKYLLKLHLKLLNSGNTFKESGSVFHRRGPLYKKTPYTILYISTWHIKIIASSCKGLLHMRNLYQKILNIVGGIAIYASVH